MRTLPAVSRRAVEPALTLAPGTTLVDARFRIERLLGRGGMGVVYSAFDRARSERVALKTLHISEPFAMLSLKREFRVLADLVHPNLVALHELFVEDELCFFTMELVDGLDFLSHVCDSRATDAASRQLAETVQSPVLRQHTGSVPAPSSWGAAPFDLERLLDSLRQLSLGVEALHLAGKLHRDLKPSNVRVSATGKLRILDFGMVVDGAESLAVAQRGEVGGTPLYMAPELFAGRPATPASDWYSIGVMLYEALTGTEPVPALQPLGTSDSVESGLAGLGADVPDELASLCLRLLSHDPAARPQARTILELLGVDEHVPRVVSAERAARTELVGRDAQLACLYAAFERSARANVPGVRRAEVVLVAGASGTGKSAMLEYFARKLQPHATVLLGRCYENEAVPHKAFDEIIDGLVRHLGTLAAEERHALVSAHGAALARLFPVFREFEAVNAPTEREREPAHEQRRRAYEALRELLVTLSEKKPLVLGIDDLHWSDADSAQLLSVLLEQKPAPRCLVIGTFRDEEIGASLERLLTGPRALSEYASVVEIRVDPLAEAEARQLATNLLAGRDPEPARVIDLVCAEAHGNPLLVRELVDHVARDGAGNSLRDIVRARAARLSDAERLLFELVCVSGRPLRQTVLKHVAGVPAELSASVTRLRAERLLRDRTSLRPDVVDVFHDRIRHAVLEELLPAERVARHALLAQAHERASEPDAEALARHYAAAGEPLRAGLWAERAAETAATALAFNRAAELFELASRLEERSPERQRALRQKLANALSDAGRGAEAAPLFLALAETAPDAEALDLRRRAAEQLLVSGHLDQALVVLDSVLAAVGLTLPRTPRAALFDLLLTRLRLRLKGLPATPPAPSADAAARIRRADVCRACWALSYVNTIQGAVFQARFLESALATGDPYRMALGLGMQSIQLSMEGGRKRAESEDYRRRARELAQSLDNPHAHGFCALADGHANYLLGCWPEAIRSLADAERIFREQCRGATWELNSTRFFWGNALAYVGRWRELEHRLGLWQRDAADRGDLFASASLLLTRTRTLALAADRPAEAEEQIERALREWRSLDFGVQQFLARVSRIQVALYRADPAAALELAERMWPEFSRSLMSRIQLCRVHAFHHTSYALLARAADARPEDRGALLRRARRYARRLRAENMPWALAFAHYIEARTSGLDGDESACTGALGSVAERFDACGMTLYAAAVRVRLAAALGGEHGKTLAADAAERFLVQGVERPERLAAVMAP